MSFDLEHECDPTTCTTGIHIDIDSGKAMNPCPICKVKHNDPDGTYRVIAMGAEGAQCILQKADPIAQFQYQAPAGVVNKFTNTNKTWKSFEEHRPEPNKRILFKDKVNDSLYYGKIDDRGTLVGHDIEMDSWTAICAEFLDRVVWKNFQGQE